MSKRLKIIRAAIQYIVAICRKSEHREDRQVESLDDQDKINTDHYHALPEEIQRKYPLKIIRSARSAFDPNQPYVGEVCDMADRGEIYGLQAVYENRLSRNHEDTGKLVQRISDGRIPYFETTSNKRYTGENSSEIFMLCLEGAMSWKDSKDKGDVIKQRMTLRAAEGKHMSRKPFGFKPHIIPSYGGHYEERITIVDEERLPYAVEMFKKAAAGWSIDALVAWALRENIRSRPSKRNPKGELTRNGIYCILHNPYFKGFNPSCRKRFMGTPHSSATAPDRTTR